MWGGRTKGSRVRVFMLLLHSTEARRCGQEAERATRLGTQARGGGTLAKRAVRASIHLKGRRRRGSWVRQACMELASPVCLPVCLLLLLAYRHAGRYTMLSYNAYCNLLPLCLL